MYALDGSLQFVSLLVVLTVRMQLGTPVGRSVSHDEPENKDSAATPPAGVSKWHKEAATSTLRPVKRYQRPMRLVAGQLAQVQARDSKVLDESVKPTYTVSSPCSGKTVVALSHISFAVRGEGARDGAVVVVGCFVGKKPSRGNGGYLRNRYHLIGGLLQFLLELLGLETDLICIGTGIVKYYMIMITIMLIVIVIVYY